MNSSGGEHLGNVSPFWHSLQLQLRELQFAVNIDLESPGGKHVVLDHGAAQKGEDAHLEFVFVHVVSQFLHQHRRSALAVEGLDDGIAHEEEGHDEHVEPSSHGGSDLAHSTDSVVLASDLDLGYFLVVDSLLLLAVQVFDVLAHHLLDLHESSLVRSPNAVLHVDVYLVGNRVLAVVQVGFVVIRGVHSAVQGLNVQGVVLQLSVCSSILIHVKLVSFLVGVVELVRLVLVAGEDHFQHGSGNEDYEQELNYAAAVSWASRVWLGLLPALLVWRSVSLFFLL